MSNKAKWITYNVVLIFALYWFSNLFLWYPWSINPILGMTLMLTVSPIFWTYGVINCLVRTPVRKLFKAVIINSFLFLGISALADFVFFGLIRGAMEDLYHPTTLFGYLFLFFLPYLVFIIGRKPLVERKKAIKRGDFILFGSVGVISFLALIFITGFNLS